MMLAAFRYRLQVHEQRTILLHHTVVRLLGIFCKHNSEEAQRILQILLRYQQAIPSVLPSLIAEACLTSTVPSDGNARLVMKHVLSLELHPRHWQHVWLALIHAIVCGVELIGTTRSAQSICGIL